MPFCIQCGNQVGETDSFCGSCGTRQENARASGFGPSPGAKRPGAGAKDFTSGISIRNAATLCYLPLVGWVASIIVLAADRFREEQNVRFHAFQGLYLFVLYLFVDWVFGPIMGSIEGTRVVAKLLKMTVFGAWIFMIVKTSQGQNVRLPILGELAERSVSEQK